MLFKKKSLIYLDSFVCLIMQERALDKEVNII